MAHMKWRLVLTGASGGIGQALAVALAPYCTAMVLVGRNRGVLETLRARLGPHLVRIVVGDATQPATLDAVVAAASELGGVNLLINNAGINDFHAFQSQDPAALRNLLEVNLLAPMLLTQRLLPQLRNASSAQVINVGSLFGYLATPGLPATAPARLACVASRRRCGASWPIPASKCGTSSRARPARRSMPVRSRR